MAALVVATAIWGSTFVVTKRSLAEMAPPTFLAWRFGIAAAVLLVVRPTSLLTFAVECRWPHAVGGPI
ncbi:EamA family transporter [Microlunatus ginsengisoli]|uniref:EamA domain-containing protein n=1 Tax=Microlunatus ginsengisoli TaxID=363863 RepID=A0ABP7ASH8_9ACTN